MCFIHIHIYRFQLSSSQAWRPLFPSVANDNSSNAWPETKRKSSFDQWSVRRNGCFSSSIAFLCWSEVLPDFPEPNIAVMWFLIRDDLQMPCKINLAICSHNLCSFCLPFKWNHRTLNFKLYFYCSKLERFSKKLIIEIVSLFYWVYEVNYNLSHL